jgi:hypothetical protein
METRFAQQRNQNSRLRTRLVLSAVAAKARTYRRSASSHAGGRDCLLPPDKIQKEDHARHCLGH